MPVELLQFVVLMFMECPESCNLVEVTKTRPLPSGLRAGEEEADRVNGEFRRAVGMRGDL